jgi:hypothetical protein
MWTVGDSDPTPAKGCPRLLRAGPLLATSPSEMPESAGGLGENLRPPAALLSASSAAPLARRPLNSACQRLAHVKFRSPPPLQLCVLEDGITAYCCSCATPVIRSTSTGRTAGIRSTITNRRCRVAENPPVATRKQPRSPSYPGIDLQAALEKAKAVFDNEQRHAAHVDTLFGHWGNNPGSGAGGVTLAALKQFGLMTDEGSGDSRRAKLTDDALAILLDEPDSPARWDGIRAAALRPPIHAAAWEKYAGSLPSDPNMRSWLIREKGFTTGGADAFINQLRKTVSYAGLSQSDRVTRSESTPSTEAPTGMATSSPPRSAATVERPTEAFQRSPERTSSGRAIQIPLGSGWATLDAPFPLTEEAWRLMITVLNAMKPGLVQPAEGDPDD